MNERQRKDYVKKMYDLSVDDIYAGTSQQANLFSTKTQLLSGADTSLQLSLSHNCLTGSLDLHIAAWMWKKAGRIIAQPNAIFPAPSKDTKIQSFSVVSESGNIPNYVQIYPNFTATCTCRNFKPKQICSHTIAVTEKEGTLNKFVAWYKQQRIKSGLSSVATLDVDKRASGRKQGPKRQRKPKENVDIVLPMPSSFLRVEMVTTTGSGAPISTRATQQTTDAMLPSTLALSSTSNAWNTPSFATYSSRTPQTQPLLNTSASQSLNQSGQLQPPHQVFSLSTELSRIPTAVGGAGQDYPFGYPGLLPQQFSTSTYTPRLSPAIPLTQQHSFRGVCPFQPSVPQGFPLPPKPNIPHSSNPFFLMKLKGDISKCNGCEGSFQKSSQFPEPVTFRPNSIGILN